MNAFEGRVGQESRFKKIPPSVLPHAVLIEGGPRNDPKISVFLVGEEADGRMVIWRGGKKSRATLEYSEENVPTSEARGCYRREHGFVIREARALGFRPNREDGTLYVSCGTVLPEFFSGWYESADLLKDGRYVNVSVFALPPNTEREDALWKMAQAVASALNLGARAA